MIGRHSVRLVGLLFLLTFGLTGAHAQTGVWPTNGWIATTPAAARMNAAKLRQARDYAGGSGFITRGGKLVMAWGSRTTLYDVKSSTKSIGGSIVGLALYDSRIVLTDPAQHYLPAIGTPPAGNASTGWLPEITPLQLATHTAGFDKPGGYPDLIFRPGTRWSYSNGGFNWLADVLTVSYGRDLNTVFFERIATPLGITGTQLKWRSHSSREDTINGIKRRELSSGISITVDAMARIGYLYLRRGKWAGQPILPSSFVDLVRKPSSSVAGLPVNKSASYPRAARHYGVMWWTNADGALAAVPKDAYWAWGLGDSLIVVIPSLDVVVSRAGPGWRNEFTADYSVLAPFLNPIAASIY